MTRTSTSPSATTDATRRSLRARADTSGANAPGKAAVATVSPEAASVIDTSTADAEIASYVSRARSRGLDAVPALSAFQRRMERYPQLSPEAQLELVDQFQAGEAARVELAGEELAKRRTSRAKDRDVRALGVRIRQGERAMEYLVGANFRLVLLICRENAEARFGRERGMEMLGDLVAEANIALTEAIKSYDVARCPVFSTYAARVVRDRVRMVLSKEGALRLAPSWSRLKRIASVRIPQLAADLGRQPTEDEIKADLLARCMEWAATKLTDEQRALPEPQRQAVMVAKLRKQGMLGAINSLQDVLMASQTVASLDAGVGEDGSATLGDMLSEPSDSGGFDDVELDSLRSTLSEALSVLTERDRTIILLRFGFADGERWTYAAIGERFGVTAERIRQIERNVLNKLAGPNAVRDRLAAFLPTMDGED